METKVEISTVDGVQVRCVKLVSTSEGDECWIIRNSTGTLHVVRLDAPSFPNNLTVLELVLQAQTQAV